MGTCLLLVLAIILLAVRWRHSDDSRGFADMEEALLLRRGPAIQLAVPPPLKLPLVQGRGAADQPRDSVRRGTAKRGRFSSHTCIGDMSTVKPRTERACVFEDVCLDTASSEVLYYRDEGTTRAPVVFDRRYGHVFSFGHEGSTGGRQDLLPLNKHVRYKRHVRWSPRIVDGPMPANALQLRPLHILSAPFVPTNLGHLAWEEAFPLLLTMGQLGVYAHESDTVVLRTSGCNSTRLCRKFVDGFMRPIGNVLTIAELAAQHASAGRTRVCFSRLVGGGFYDMFNTPTHPGKEAWLQLYRHRVLAHHRLAPPRGWSPPPSAHKMLIIRKEGRRGIANFDEVLSYVSSGCEGMCQGIRSVVPVAFQTMSIREQLQLVSSSTIALTPPGGVSMILPFLPEGAHAILINYMLGDDSDTKHLRGAEGTCQQCSLTMEASLWRHMRHVRTLLYQVWEPSDFGGGQIGRHASVEIKLPRIAYLLRVALDAMSPRHTAG